MGSIVSAMTGLLALAKSGDAQACAVATLCVSISLLLDRIDGPLARKLGVASKFGAILDTLADLTAFGVLPAVFMAKVLSGNEGMDLLLAASAIVYVCAACWRLAKFDEVGLIKTRLGECFVGAPTAVAGAALTCLLVVSFYSAIPPWVIELSSLILAAGMVSNIPYPKRGIGAWPWMIIMPIVVIAAWKRI